MSGTVLSHALRYAATGWRVIPIRPGGKRPTITAWQSYATDDRATIVEWLSSGNLGVGIATGAGSGLWVLDVDIADGKQGQENLDLLQSWHGELPPTVMAQTGSGGAHYFFKWDHDRPITNGMATRLGAGLDIRGEGGQVVAPPTRHPNGQLYRWVVSPFDGVEVAAAPEWLYDLLLADDPGPEPEPSRAPIVIEPSGQTLHINNDSIADWINDQHDWHDLLASTGWTQTGRKSGPETLWARPGKDARLGHSAVLHEPSGPLVVFSTEIPADLASAGQSTADGSGLSFSIFRFIAGTYHGGDMRQAASIARRAKIDQEGRAVQAAPAPLSPDNGNGFVDLAPWWDDDQPVKRGDVLTRTDGVSLMYGDQLNWIHGESGSGKTWVMLYSAVQMVAARRHVAWIHYEDPNPRLVVERLRQLGVARDLALEYFHYFDPKADGLDVPSFIGLCAGVGISFACLDSVGEALNAAGVNENNDDEVGPWIVGGPRAIVNAGIGFCGIDHTNKADPNGLHASGSKRKRAATTGTSLVVEALIPPTRHANGRLKVVCAKDRQGNFQSGHTVGELRLTHSPAGGSAIKLEAPHDPGKPRMSAEHERMIEVVQLVCESPGISKSAVRTVVSFKGNDKVQEAISMAETAGYIRIKKASHNKHYLHPTERGQTVG